MPNKAKRSRLWGRAAEAERHDLYQLSVQDPPSEVEFVGSAFETIRGREALTLREDFCGTAVFSLAWLASDDRRTAIGVDLDRPTLDWGVEHRLRPACARDGKDYEARLTLRNANVLQPEPPRVDVAVAFNFSYWCFWTRDELRAYFEATRAGLVDDGVLVLDCFGGTEVPMPDLNERTVEDEDGVVNDGEPFTYAWEQYDYNPTTARMDCVIHFAFEDGSRLDEAFRYEWRIWTLPELRELLLEAGFSAVRFWAEIEDEDGDGTGRYEQVEDLDNEGVWWVYISAEN